MRLLSLTIAGGLLLLTPGLGAADPPRSAPWYERPPEAWPQLTMINEITYVDTAFAIAGCGFLLDVGPDTLAATAKHILTFFRSQSMHEVSFAGTLESWRMYPKDNPDDVVIIDRLINEDSSEPVRGIPAHRDWLLFTLEASSPHIQPLTLRTEPLVAGEPVYIVGWRYTDRDCPQVIYPGAFVRTDDGTILISTEDLADNTMPGLSGSPVIDARGRVIGLMSQKAGELERLSSVAYPREVLAGEQSQSPRKASTGSTRAARAAG